MGARVVAFGKRVEEDQGSSGETPVHHCRDPGEESRKSRQNGEDLVGLVSGEDHLLGGCEEAS